MPIAKVEPAGAAWMAFTMKSVEPAASAASTTGIGHSGCTITCTPGCVGARLRDLVDREAPVHRAEAVPEDDAGVAQLVGGAAAERLARVPHRHLLERHAHGLRGVAAEVLVGEEEHALPALERPLEHRLRVRRGADDAAVAPDEALERRRRVHVGDGDDRHPAVGVGRAEVAVDLGELLPALLDARLVGHVGHRAARGEVRQDHGLLGRRQQVGGLGHEVHAAEHDGLGIGPGERGVRELERVADEVGVLDDLVALVEVAEHDDAVAEGRLGGTDAIVQLGVGGLAVLGRQRALARRAGGDHVAHRGAGPVAGGAAVELPRALRQLGRAGRARPSRPWR